MSGAAIALIDAVYLPLHLSDITIRMIGYGLPRVRKLLVFFSLVESVSQVGNQAFANYLDATTSVTHVNNKLVLFDPWLYRF